MSSDNLALYTGYQYRVGVQGYEVIEVDMYIQLGIKSQINSSVCDETKES